MLVVTRMAHPLVPIHEKIPTLPISIGVRGVTNEPQQRAPGHEAVHASRLGDLDWMVTVKEFFHRQPLSTVGYSPIKDLHAKEDPSGV